MQLRENFPGVFERSQRIFPLASVCNEKFPQSISKMLDEICKLVSHITHAPTVLIGQRDPQTNTIKVRGKAGTLVTEVDMTFVLPDLDPDKKPVLISSNVRLDPRLENHPLLKLMPHVRSLMALLVPGQEKRVRAVLKILNPRKSAMSDALIMSTLSDFCVIIADLLDLERALCEAIKQGADAMAGLPQQLPHGSGFFEPSDAADVVPDIKAATRFLLDTLVARRGLHAREGVDYVSLRSWRTSIKKFQIAALTALKDDPPPQMVAGIAQEFVEYVIRAHGASVIKSVVPVPPGNSGKLSSLSTMVAEAVAHKLGAAYCNILVPGKQVTRGASSPHKSAHLTSYKVNTIPNGPILIVDDVVSSGRHLELAVKAFKAPHTGVYAVAWVGR